MPLSEKAQANKRKYIVEYAREKYKRVPLDLKQDYYNAVKAFLDSNGYKVNTYIKDALSEKLKRDGFVYNPEFRSSVDSLPSDPE